MIIYIGQIIFITLAVIGGITVVIIVPDIITNVIIPPIKNFLTRKCKFRFLCKHEYVSTVCYKPSDRYEHVLECRKCGHIKKLVIYKNKTGGN